MVRLGQDALWCTLLAMDFKDHRIFFLTLSQVPKQSNFKMEDDKTYNLLSVNRE